MFMFVIGLAVGAVVMDYLWARKTGVDRMLYETIKRKFTKR